MERKMIRVTTADGQICWINSSMIVGVYRNKDYNKVAVSTVMFVNDSFVELPGTPDEVMAKVIGT